MPRFGKRSISRLKTCDQKLQELFYEVVKHFDCSIIEGHRGEERQNKAFADGKSKVKYPNGKHNQNPSIAVDVAPYPIDWSDRDRFHYFGGFVLGVAKEMGMNIRWGGDWNQDTHTKDNKFDDLVHFEIKG
jgi:peptidoglycan L-alanyl-D-glutamate endopeptidase CwlK|tara:strand:+ start:1348 stop:1740 length:393 start_codon:yes stop_codon:yes gene_type:complete